MEYVQEKKMGALSVGAVVTAIVLGVLANLGVGAILVTKNKLEFAKAENQAEKISQESETIEELMPSLNFLKTGESGKNGANGFDGKNGTNGTNGINGENGQNGVNGSNGQNGENGLDGETGNQGAKGVAGDTGTKGLTTGFITSLERTTQERIYYVNSSSGSDITGVGSLDSPYATVQKAINSVPEKISHNTTIQVAAGTYREGLDFKKIIDSGKLFTIKGDASDPNSYRITGADAGAETTAVRSYGLVNRSNGKTGGGVKVEGLRFDYFKNAGFYSYFNANTQLKDIVFHRCANSTTSVIYMVSFSRIDIYGSLSITGDGNDSGFYAYAATNTINVFDGATINIYNVAFGIDSFSGLIVNSSSGATWNIDNSQIAKTGVGIQAWHGERIKGIKGTMKNLNYGVWAANLALISIGTIEMTNVTTAINETLGGVVVEN
ncbi:MAG: Collagen triple helix repeat (20 copies) [candidate division WS2 bacterium ADurb.Bin280]|uniref:Collagen triple helix repeat (20 copies) n=1 Tax=candidate division WS2 bacterium ADurb.Bin280 TaxID=1852829 RepID=A0A1V5SF77_9BACT|nr:MAG: Collagen triple helix repeat (20 copies) [candidate division WS2 bacterium ADurb.Bin280]